MAFVLLGGPLVDTPPEEPSFIDHHLASMPWRFTIALCILLPPIALLLGIVGAVVCQVSEAKARSVDLIMFGGVASGFVMVLLLG